MALFARLYFGDNYTQNYHKEYKIVACNIGVARDKEKRFLKSEPKCDQVMVTIVAPDKDDLEVYKWYTQQDLKSGKIEFDLSNQSIRLNQNQRTIYFDDAQCYAIRENYDIDKQERHQLTFEFMVREITIDAINFETENY